MAIRTFMDTDAKGQLGGVECSRDARERMARDSGKWTCAGCGKSNAETMKEREDAVKEIVGMEGKRTEEEVPEELRLAYRDELGQKEEADAEKLDKEKGKAVEEEVQPGASTQSTTTAAPVHAASTQPSSSAVVSAAGPTGTIPAVPLQQMAQQSADRSLAWIDACIWCVLAMLLFMVIKKFAFS